MKNVTRILLLSGIVMLSGCSSNDKPSKSEDWITFNQYSTFVQDTFQISIQLPKTYHEKPDKHFPTVVLLDGNFYFPMIASMMHRYEEAGLLPPMVLVGVGYNSFEEMDSLRVRDYLFPASIPSDEMHAVGGGEKFNAFLTQELLPKVDAEFRTKKGNRVLAGHSFGGYFALYSLLHQVKNKSNDFKTFISASPSLWYNDFYLKQIPAELSTRNTLDSLNVFLTVGGLEDSTWSVSPVRKLTTEIQHQNLKAVNLQTRVYSDLEHMDVGVLSITKGLQEFYK
jgi:uncharacterized protein